MRLINLGVLLRNIVFAGLGLLSIQSCAKQTPSIEVIPDSAVPHYLKLNGSTLECWTENDQSDLIQVDNSACDHGWVFSPGQALRIFERLKACGMVRVP